MVRSFECPDYGALPASVFVPVTRRRVLDTRASSQTEASGPGNAHVLPAGSSETGAWSSLNSDGPDRIVADTAVVPLGPGGNLDVFTQTSAHLVMDMAGVFVAAPPDPTDARHGSEFRRDRGDAGPLELVGLAGVAAGELVGRHLLGARVEGDGVDRGGQGRRREVEHALAGALDVHGVCDRAPKPRTHDVPSHHCRRHRRQVGGVIGVPRAHEQDKGPEVQDLGFDDLVRQGAPPEFRPRRPGLAG